MIWGNFVALLQDNLKRLLAYSSIAHAGYLMVGVTAAFANDRTAAASITAPRAVFFYLVAYALMTLGAVRRFICAADSEDRAVETVDDLAGLGLDPPVAGAGALDLPVEPGRHPAACSASGGNSRSSPRCWPPRNAAKSGSFIMLAVIGMLSAAVGAYYYLRIVVVMYLRPSKGEVTVGGGWPVAVAVGVCVSLTLVLGLYSTPVAGGARAAAQAAMDHPQLSPAHVAAGMAGSASRQPGSL